MGFRSPDRTAIENGISRAVRVLRQAVEDVNEMVEDLKVDITDSGETVNKAGAQAFAESVLGLPAGTDLGESGPWADTVVDANAVAGAFQTTLDAQIEKIRRIVFD